jgi:uncharacterized protein with PIN domain
VESFLVDQMLMRLGRWLRLLGQNVANPDTNSDDELLQKAKREKRILITRDKRLAEACQKQQKECILIKSSNVSEQLLEMGQIGIPMELKPKRCTICNLPLQNVESKERKTWICTGCKRLYWEGSHWKRMEKMLENIRSIKEQNAR